MRHSILLLLALVPMIFIGQVPQSSQFENQIESLLEDENESNLVQLADQLEFLRSNRLKINFATFEELAQLSLLNVFQIHNLLEYRNQTGPILSPYELKNIKGFNRELIEKLMPFLSFSTENGPPKLKWSRIKKYGRQQILARHRHIFQRKSGFRGSNRVYKGIPHDFFVNYRFRYSEILKFSMTVQQDPGESFNQTGTIDFLSANLNLKNYGRLKTLVLGDYHLELGQGLITWTGAAFGKSADVINIKKFGRGIQAYSGIEENRFFRGIAGSIRIKNWDFTGFYSNRKLDANGLAENSVSSLLSSGLHRTDSELEDKNALRMQVLGGNIKLRGKPYSASVNAIRYELNKTLLQSSNLSRLNHFHGSVLNNISIDVNYIIGNFNLFGEFAVSDNFSSAGLIGLQSNPADGFYLSLVQRIISPDYQFLYNSPFAEKGSNGEIGTYLGVDWSLNPYLGWKAYLDVYQFRWPVFRSHFPSQGLDILSQWNIKLNRFLDFYFRLRYEIREQQSNQEKILPILERENQLGSRLQLNFQAQSNVKLYTRIETRHLSHQHETGLLIYQDLQYAMPQIPIKFKTRFTLFETSSFDSRIYAYENDLSYTFSIPSFSGLGRSYYLLLDWEINKGLKFQIKYVSRTFSDREFIGSGLEQIDGNRVSEIKWQIKYRF